MACARFGISTPIRQAAFVSQCAHESMMFTRLEESLYYRTPERICAIFPTSVPTIAIAMPLVGKPEALANHVYANRLGNGNEASADGWRFRGRGLIQLTGRTNYTKADTAIERPYVEHPDLLLSPDDAALAAAWFWYARSLNILADSSEIDTITRAVNGSGMEGAAERRQLFAETLHAFQQVA
jgi:putative chitinase